jgi:hypothetical protein
VSENRVMRKTFISKKEWLEAWERWKMRSFANLYFLLNIITRSNQGERGAYGKDVHMGKKWQHNFSYTNWLEATFGETYRISRPIRRTFFPKKCDLNKTCIVCAEGKMTFYMKKVTHRVKTTMKTILVAVTTIFWVSVMNKLYYGY